MFFQPDWNIPLKNHERNVIVDGYYPSDFNWDIEKINVKQIKKVKLIIKSQMSRGGGLPSIDYGTIPYPIFPKERLEWLKKYIPEENLHLLSLGHIYNGRYKEGHKYLIFIPDTKYRYSSSTEVPKDLKMVFINNYFCIHKSIIDDSYNYNGVIFEAFKDKRVYPFREPVNYDQFFIKRNPIVESVLENKLYDFIIEALNVFKNDKKEKISCVLLDTDPVYGYLIIGIKTSKFINKNIEVDEFEYPQYLHYESDKIYTNSDMLSETKYRKAILNVIERLSNDSLIEELKSDFGLRIAYAFHDEDIEIIKSIC